MLEPASIVSLSCEDVGQGCKHVTVKRARGRSARIIHSIQPLRSPESRLATCHIAASSVLCWLSQYCLFGVAPPQTLPDLGVELMVGVAVPITNLRPGNGDDLT